MRFGRWQCQQQQEHFATWLCPSSFSDTLQEASLQAKQELLYAQETASKAHTLHTRLLNLRVSRLAESLMGTLRFVQRAAPAMQRELGAVVRVGHELSGAAGVAKEQEFLVPAFHSVNAAATQVSKVRHGIWSLLRQVRILADQITPSHIAPSTEDALDAPHDKQEHQELDAPHDEQEHQELDAPHDEKEHQEQSELRTAADCTCDDGSLCAQRGRPFYWCKTKESAARGLAGSAALHDPAGADHRVAGSEQPTRLWDYCHPPVLPEAEGGSGPSALAVHEGGKCEFRDDLLDKYMDNSEYKTKYGVFQWSKVPWRDRLALEALVHPDSIVQGLCVTTPSSSGLHICPVSCDTEISSGSEERNPEWCSSHSWDFCVPAPEHMQTQPMNTMVAALDFPVFMFLMAAKAPSAHGAKLRCDFL